MPLIEFTFIQLYLHSPISHIEVQRASHALNLKKLNHLIIKIDIQTNKQTTEIERVYTFIHTDLQRHIT